MAQLPKYAIQAQTLRDEQLHQNLDNLDDGRFSIWASASTTNAKTHDGQKLNDPNIMLGMDAKGNSSRVGLYVTHNNQDYAPTPAIDAKMKTTGVGFYGQKEEGGFRVRANVGVNDTKMDTKRDVVWEGQKRTHTAQTDVSGINAGLQVSYGIQANNLTVRPHVGLHGQSLKVDTLSESDPHLSTAMAYDFDDRTSLHTRVGVDVAYQLGNKTTFNLGVAHRHEIGNNSEPHFVETRLPSLVNSYLY
ncbi:autotransporter outer membrane beta-barrel domain-containing protein [Moraxella oblonga]|uniref:autotransporter outer membrane beta-barrel domain-containing protein n=1 Tax=Moraxella oblonga TaxID=200413 RepID=UPI00082FA19D|nr:autotransporter outer membrane beta-barrel domain-containing protein [Moraxella oblonga]